MNSSRLDKTLERDEKFIKECVDDVTIPEKCVGVAADHQVDVGNLFGNLHVLVITCVTDCNENVDPFLFETLGFLSDAFNFVENSNAIGAGHVLENKIKSWTFSFKILIFLIYI